MCRHHLHYTTVIIKIVYLEHSFYIFLGSQIHETTSLPQPEAHTRLQNTFVSVHSYKDGKQRFFIKKDGSSQTNEKGLQIEVPLLREIVEKQPAVRPYFISYSLLGSNDKNQYGNDMLTSLNSCFTIYSSNCLIVYIYTKC